MLGNDFSNFWRPFTSFVDVIVQTLCRPPDLTPTLMRVFLSYNLKGNQELHSIGSGALSAPHRDGCQTLSLVYGDQ